MPIDILKAHTLWLVGLPRRKSSLSCRATTPLSIVLHKQCSNNSCLEGLSRGPLCAVRMSWGSSPLREGRHVSRTCRALWMSMEMSHGYGTGVQQQRRLSKCCCAHAELRLPVSVKGHTWCGRAPVRRRCSVHRGLSRPPFGRWLGIASAECACHLPEWNTCTVRAAMLM